MIGGRRFAVVYDACVLFPFTLRDFLLRLRQSDLFRAHWTAEIHAEWISAVLARRANADRAKLQRTRDLMDEHFPDALVTGHQPLIASLSLPDPNDRHVLAAAIKSGASLIVTTNLTDFPASALDPFGVEAIHPDEFVLDLFELAEGAVVSAAKRARAALKNPSFSPEEYLARLAANGLVGAAGELKEFAEVI
ncbi:MAG: PIN domain-containing protein [Proteobacteria bacterium HN_bin10]|nr:MAG: PIN domain-containing protein [Proteobacteria bacterium HN_bin10]